VGASAPPQGLRPKLNGVRTIPLRNDDAARMFYAEPYRLEGYGIRTDPLSWAMGLDLERDLAQVTGRESAAREIVWAIRQAAFQAGVVRSASALVASGGVGAPHSAVSPVYD
jgi:hypothetical protein